MLNKIMLIGNLGADPDLKYTQAGTPVCRFSVATTESYTDGNGQRVDNTEWHRIAVFNKTAEACSKFLHKGSKIYVEGSVRTRKWTDQSGQERSTTEVRADRVQFLDAKTSDAPKASRPTPQHAPANQFPTQPSEIDNVPF